MCDTCGCSINGQTHEHSHDHGSHTHGSHEHSHDHGSHSHAELSQNPQLNDPKTINAVRKILDKNDQEALHNNEHFNANSCLAINLMSSPGSGKTSVLEKLAKLNTLKFCVIEGDLETENDAARLNALGIKTHTIQTGSACHLDAFMVHSALHHLDLKNADVCFIENVGNLVCPASYALGSHLNVVFLSVTEGDDKIEKYPVIFAKADLVIISKTDIIEHFDFDIAKVKKSLAKIKPSCDILSLNIKDNSVEKFVKWINYKLELR